VPARRTTASRLEEVLLDHAPDLALADDLEAARADLRASCTDRVRTWPDASFWMTIAATAAVDGRTLLTTDTSADSGGLAGLNVEVVRTV